MYCPESELRVSAAVLGFSTIIQSLVPTAADVIDYIIDEDKKE